MLIGFTNFKFNYFKTREITVDLMDALNVSRLFIIIDEWSELDRSVTRNVQLRPVIVVVQLARPCSFHKTSARRPSVQPLAAFSV